MSKALTILILLVIPLSLGHANPLARQDLAKTGQQKAEPRPAETQAASQQDPASSKIPPVFAEQVHLLAAEIRKLRRSTERNSMTMELLLLEERLARLEDKIESTEYRRVDLDASERNLQYRLDNIQQELILRGGLNRDESEAAIRNQLNSSIQDVHNQQAASQKRLADAQAEASRLRSRIKALRATLDSTAASGDKTDDRY
jgi:chromosome segregation ATPase